ncbi:arginine N-succinyltransferase [Niveibacterium sp. SC-1]|uniref:arginine N-succinyltransferase n=1 Tax=Niveibacterium sp. SC-1 TaxID=3135646 RepID=UPI00311DEAC4
MRIRPIRSADLPALLELARATGVGVTSLPPDEARLARRIATSEASFAGTASREVANYLFVLEDDAAARVVGTCGIAVAVGLDEPWYNYRVGTAVHHSPDIGVYRQLQTLFLTNDLTGDSELCSLFLHPDYRRGGNGGLLSRSRLLFLAAHPQRFSPRVFAELRGVSDAEGRAPFWESLGRHFFQMEFAQADMLSGVGDKGFIAELMPQHPVYTAFLSEAAQAVIGEVHEATRPARAMLEAEGFAWRGYCDIFDAGPAVECELPAIRTVRDSRALCAGRLADEGEATGDWLVCNGRHEDFRAVRCRAVQSGDELLLGEGDLARLEVRVGDPLRVTGAGRAG